MALPRYRHAAVAAVAACLLTLTACGKSADNVNADPSGQGQLGDGPSGSATVTTTTPAATTTTTGGGGGGGGGTQVTTYPSDAKTYGLEILKAIGSNNDARIVDLSSLNTAQYVQQQNYKSKNSAWTYADCQSGGTQMCHYYNQTGDIATVGVESTKLGKAGAVSSVYIDGSTFPTDAGGYVQAFIMHWINGNNAGMLAYANQTVINVVKTKTKPTGGFVTQPTSCGTSRVCLDGGEYLAGGQPSGTLVHYVVDTSKLGKPNAIVSAS